ncbi:hypothetical protein [Tengunoibacter tsumagoiensis]|uniref:Cytochrome b561 domain-containing protein n=1 Tax=Tengunoibacter tsumagoiensis TaxID=2014871 RepID=A0A402A4G6_9CHLR|nr:hypothetical protein [Tengunoibacter tsumagoiensis]GCE14002.1 hypothetical protein KTT_38610 [Tengunoibacter tsumagoiensis]
MALRISSMVLRICGLLALILGLIFWIAGIKGALVPVHMLLGLLIAIALWVEGGVIATAKGGNIGLGIAAFVIGVLLIWLGLTQASLMVGSSHWIIQVLHLLLGLIAISLGEAITGIYRKRVRKAL